MSRNQQELKANSANRGVALKENTDVAVIDPRALALLQTGAGQEDLVGRDVVAIPFLTILQPLSPQVNPSDSDYIEGARPGSILQTASKEIRTAFQFIPVKFQRSFLEWVPRDNGGGFRGEHTGAEAIELFNSKLDRATGRAKLDNGNDLADTRSYYGLVVSDEGALSPAMVSMSSTQIKASKNWNTLIRDYLPPGLSPAQKADVPVFAGVYSLTSVQQENKKGKWYGWRVTRIGGTPYEMLVAADAFYNQVMGGIVTVDRTALDPEATGAADDSDRM